MAVKEADWWQTSPGNLIPDKLVDSYRARNRDFDHEVMKKPAHVFVFSEEEKEAIMKRQKARTEALSRKD